MNTKGSFCEVLVENKLPNQEKYFGRNRFMSPVVIDSGDYVPGNLINVQIHSANQLSLFGKYIKNPTAISALWKILIYYLQIYGQYIMYPDQYKFYSYL